MVLNMLCVARLFPMLCTGYAQNCVLMFTTMLYARFHVMLSWERYDTGTQWERERQSNGASYCTRIPTGNGATQASQECSTVQVTGRH